MPWLNLHAPINLSGKPTGISHWYTCGTTTTTTPTAQTHPPTTPPTLVSHPQSAAPASTGLGRAWLLPLGGLLVLFGGAAMLLARRRRLS